MTEIDTTGIIKRTKEWWDRKFLSLTAEVASFSKDPSTQVGAIIISPERRIMSTGYNGLPKHIPDSVEILNDRKLKYPLVNHAEKNAFEYSDEYGLNVSGCTIFTWPFLPCTNCYELIKNHKITRIVAPVDNNPRWIEHFEQIRLLCKKDNIEIVEIKI